MTARRLLPPLLVLAAFGLVPLVHNGYVVRVATIMLFFAFLASSWNVVGGYAGQLSLGHALFFGIGAYGVALSAQYGLSPALGIVLALVVGGLTAFCIGSISFRFHLRGIYFAVATLLVAEIGRIIVTNWGAIGGANGITIGAAGLAGRSLYFFYAALVMVFCVIALGFALERSRFGFRLVAVREQDQSAEALGIRADHTKTAAFVLSAALTVLGGAVDGWFNGFVSPGDFSLDVTMGMVLGTYIGGRGTVWGPVIGGGLMYFLQEGLENIGAAFTASSASALAQVVYGVMLVLIILMFPDGIVGTIVRNRAERKSRTLSDAEMQAQRAVESGPASAATPLREAVAGSRIVAKGVTKRFGGLIAVNGVDLSVESREIVGLIGPNGAGKSTLFSIIAGATSPNEGSVELDGASLTQRGAAAVAQAGIARTFQICKPFRGLSVLDNVMIGTFSAARSYREAEQAALLVLERLGLLSRRDQLADTLTLPDLKRLEFARAVAIAPRFILLDEVMAGLTPDEQEEAALMIEAVHRTGIGIVLVEHSIAMVMRLCKRIVVLDEGRKIADGVPSEVIAMDAVRTAYMGDEVAHA